MESLQDLDELIRNTGKRLDHIVSDEDIKAAKLIIQTVLDSIKDDPVVQKAKEEYMKKYNNGN